MGSECRRRHPIAGRGATRRSRDAVDARRARAARRLRSGVRDVRDDRELLGAGGCPARALRAQGLGRRHPRPVRGAAHHRRRRRGSARQCAQSAWPARARTRSRGAGAGRRSGTHARRRAAAARRSHHPLHPGRQREHRRVRSRRCDRAAGATCRRVGARGWRVRAVGRSHSGAGAPARGVRRCRFVGDRRAQVAQRAVRQRHRVRPRTAAPARCHEHVGGVPRARRAARPLRLHARVFPARPRRRGLGSAAIARSRRTGRSRRALVPPRVTLCRRSARRRLRDSERRRHQSGPRVIRRSRDDASGDCGGPGRRHVLGRRHRVARAHGHAHQRVVVGDDG